MSVTAESCFCSRNQKNSILTRKNQDLTTAKTGNSGFVPQILVVSYGRNPENRSVACGTRFPAQR